MLDVEKRRLLWVLRLNQNIRTKAVCHVSFVMQSKLSNWCCRSMWESRKASTNRNRLYDTFSRLTTVGVEPWGAFSNALQICTRFSPGRWLDDYGSTARPA